MIGMNILKTADIFKTGGEVKRFHTRHLNKPQDVAQHSFNAALIANEIASMLDDSEIRPYEVMLHMLVHDLPEQYVGDAPGHVKGGHPELKKVMDKIEEKWMREHLPHQHYRAMYDLNEKESILCSFVDNMECAFHVMIDAGRGNAIETRVVFEHCISSMKKKANKADDLGARELCLALYKITSTLKEHGETVYDI